jgi:hypothetical protein
MRPRERLEESDHRTVVLQHFVNTPNHDRNTVVTLEFSSLKTEDSMEPGLVRSPQTT